MKHSYSLDEELAFYATPAPMTVLPADGLEGAPGDPEGIVQLVRGLLVHEVRAAREGWEVPALRRDELQVRSAADMLACIRKLDPRPLTVARPLQQRMVVNCRHFAVLICALLRRAGVPVRARCGHATYFEPGRYVDHWIVERWNDEDRRWVQVDPDMDGNPNVDFDPFDIPAGRFLSGGEAWRLLRAGEADPQHFGFHVWWGAWYVRCNVVRDLAALNKVELLPWDAWGLMDRESELGCGPSDALVDEVAATDDWVMRRRMYEGDDLLRVPSTLQ